MATLVLTAFVAFADIEGIEAVDTILEQVWVLSKFSGFIHGVLQ